MSLINKMLTDLEARRRPVAESAPSFVYGDLHPAVGTGRRPRRVALLLLLLLAFAALGLFARDRLAGTEALTQQLVAWGTAVREWALPSVATPAGQQHADSPANAADVVTPVVETVSTQAPSRVVASAAPSAPVPPPVAAPAQTLTTQEPAVEKVAPGAVATKPKPESKPKVSRAATTRAKNTTQSKVAARVSPNSIQGPQHPAPTTTPLAAPTQGSDSPGRADTPQGRVEKQVKSLSAEEQAENAYREGVRRLQESRLADAEKKLREALERNPRHVDARELLVGLVVRKGRAKEAQQLLEEGRTLVPDHYRFAQLLARVYVQGGAEDKGLALLEQVQDSAQRDAEFQGLLATLYQRAGRHRDAIKAYGRAVILSPDQSQWWLALAISLEAERSWGAAYSSYLRAVGGHDLDPSLVQYAKQRLTALRPRVTAPAAPKVPAVARGDANEAAN